MTNMTFMTKQSISYPIYTIVHPLLANHTSQQLWCVMDCSDFFTLL